MGLMPDKHLSGNSVNWKNWESKLKFTTCAECFKKHGTIYDTTFERDDIMPIHPNGLCELPFMRTKMAGTVTKLGPLGADAQLCYLKKLPDFYVTKKDALKSGWKRALGNLNDVLPGKSIGGDVFYNDLGKLPSEASRVWREADFDIGMTKEFYILMMVYCLLPMTIIRLFMKYYHKWRLLCTNKRIHILWIFQKLNIMLRCIVP